MLIICLSCAWVLGILLGSYLDLPWYPSLVGLIPLVLLFFNRRHRRRLVMAGLGIMAVFTAAAYAHHNLHDFDEGHLRYYNDGGTVTIRGAISEAPDVRDTDTRLRLDVDAIRLEEGWQEVEGTALVLVPRYPVYGYGDLLLVAGELETPPRLGDFDYHDYLAHQGIYTTVLYPEIEVLETGRGSETLAWVYGLRARLAGELARLLPEPQASLAQGIVLGLRDNIPQPLRDDFNRSGTAHLLAISGLHLGIMAGILLALGTWLFGRRWYLYVWLALGGIWFYALITGMHLPVVRGAIMASLFLMAELLGRQRSAVVTLALAAAVMVGVHPYILGDAAFQLSFLAMAGLIFIFPILRNLGRRAVAGISGYSGFAPVAGLAVDGLSVSLGAVIAVWPVLAYYFGTVPLVGPVATFLALPVLPGIIITGALAAALGLMVVGWVAWLCLAYLELVVGGMAALPVAAVAAGSFSPVFVWGYYLVLALALWLAGRWRWPKGLSDGVTAVSGAGLSGFSGLSSFRKWLMLPLLAAAVLVVCTAAAMPDAKLRVSFLDVGEGDAVLIQQGSRQVLVDGGPSPRALNLELGRRMPFWDRTIDLVVLTHPHQDHLAGLTEVLRRYRVERVLDTDFDYASLVYEEWLRLIEEEGIERVAACAGQRIDFGNGTVMTVLHPSEEPLDGMGTDADNHSVVLRLSSGAVSFLLTGDIMMEAERILTGERAELPGTVLKVAHHGSAAATTPGFLAVVNPEVAVISTGAGNSHGHPADEVLARLEERLGPGSVYRTDEQGTIGFITDGERLWVEVAAPVSEQGH